MQDRILSKTRIGNYVENAWDGENRSGITPIGDQVLVLPDKSVRRTAGGIELPDSIADTHDGAAESGIIAAIGDGAWTWNMDRTRRFEGNKPRVGDRVVFTRYAGLERYGNDGPMYRLMSDNCIGGLCDVPSVPKADAA